MKVLMVASEAEPFSKTGGLADVMGALPRALAQRGHEIGVVIPLYGAKRPEGAEVRFPSVTIRMGAETHYPTILTLSERGVLIYLAEYPPYFDREGYYGTADADYPDNAQRFMLLCRAALQIARLDFQPQLLHCHDWQSAMVPVLIKTVDTKDPAVKDLPVLFTVHNLGYQGQFPAHALDAVGLPRELFHVDALEFYGNVNYLKGGLVYADALSTVSETYAQEIQTPEFGHGLDGFMRKRRNATLGVLNGVDYTLWNPAADELIAARYDSEDLYGKRLCKKDLLETLGLSSDSPERPVIGWISRLTEQKGADLLAAAAERLLALDVALVMLGAGEPRYLSLFEDIRARFPGQVAFRAAHDETLAHKIEAGADMFLMPSRYEPCGLNQMYSMKYGTIPVVRAVGGLEDTVREFDPGTGQGTGFKFRDFTPEAMLEAIGRALETYGDRDAWNALVRNAMAEDFSWQRSAPRYERIYENLLSAQ